MLRTLSLLLLIVCLSVCARASTILIPMDDTQTDHLKAYGITFWVLNNNIEAWWLLNYRGGSFAFQHSRAFERECLTRGVKYEVIPDSRFNGILAEIADPEKNMDAMKLEKAPKIAVYTPDYNFREGTEVQPWDDAVTLVLTYAEIPYETVYDNEVLEDKLAEYDWLHLHHEDFTGQFGRFYRSFHTAPWYRRQVAYQEELAAKNGYAKVSQLKLGVVKKVKEYVGGGGFMFAMCSATDSYDIALAADGTDICAQILRRRRHRPQRPVEARLQQDLRLREFSAGAQSPRIRVQRHRPQPPPRYRGTGLLHALRFQCQVGPRADDAHPESRPHRQGLHGADDGLHQRPH